MKYGICFEEAATVFYDEKAILFDDPDHSSAFGKGKSMRDEYDIEKLHPRKNPYSGRAKKQITINIDVDTIEYFKSMSEQSGIPYQTLINLYLTDCAVHHRKLQMSWK